TIRIHCHIDEEDKELLPGMYLNAVVEAGGALVPALPAEAIVEYQGKKYVFVTTDETHTNDDSESEKDATAREGQHFEIVEVQTGNSEFGFIEITSPGPLNKDSQIVVEGAYALLSTMKNSEEEGGHGH
ncbi:MAG: efflux transporter periplasmic adaptor subunit, partial [Bacteroidota bacterium]|nr:efflux transporter periplasmic adaptor subunit [Bacteroidota bacterium]